MMRKSTTAPRDARRVGAPSPIARRAAMSLLAALALLGPLPRAARAQEVSEVRVERVRPQREKHPTLRFLKQNIGFLRAELDRLREHALPQSGAAGAIDLRFLAYRELLAQIMSADDSVSTADDARRRSDLLQSITQLGELESHLDRLDRELAEQRDRLALVQRDFTGDQRTALVVMMSGYPEGPTLTQVTVTLEDGSPLTIPISDPDRETLKTGGVIQIFHGFVEPREQVVEVAVAGDRWPTGDAGYVTLDPARDRLTLLRLDLRGVSDRGTADIHASTWLNDERIP
jgi:uncharacterized tellurite resistance protein B-like protein